jgi:hypothetical protein
MALRWMVAPIRGPDPEPDIRRGSDASRNRPSVRPDHTTVLTQPTEAGERLGEWEADERGTAERQGVKWFFNPSRQRCRMSKASLLAGFVGLPLLMPLMLVACLTPGYVPSDSLSSAAASTASPELARRRMMASFVGRCRGNWNIDRSRSGGTTTLYSWENDAGLIGKTEITCVPGRRCSVAARALMKWPLPSQLGGRPVPTRIWGCGVAPPDWQKAASSRGQRVSTSELRRG